MRYVLLPAIFVLVGCADSAPTSTDRHADDSLVAGTLTRAPTQASVSAIGAIGERAQHRVSRRRHSRPAPLNRMRAEGFATR